MAEAIPGAALPPPMLSRLPDGGPAATARPAPSHRAVFGADGGPLGMSAYLTRADREVAHGGD